MEQKRWRKLVQPGEFFHLARFRFTPERRALLHTHDFPEIFWIESGTGRHVINDQRKRLDPGDLIFVRPSDCHVLAAADRDGFMLVNLAFSPAVLSGLLTRHRDDLRPFHDPSTPLPTRRHLSAAQIKQLSGEINGLWQASRRRLALEKFLLELYTMLQPVYSNPGGPLPDWLAEACMTIQKQSYFSEGAAGLVRAARRSPEHVARVVRAQFNCTPSAYVNRIRMDFAARELRLSSRPILEIALECGIHDLSHFYELFRGTFGQTPRRYRLAQQMQTAQVFK